MRLETSGVSFDDFFTEYLDVEIAPMPFELLDGLCSLYVVEVWIIEIFCEELMKLSLCLRKRLFALVG